MIRFWILKSVTACIFATCILVCTALCGSQAVANQNFKKLVVVFDIDDLVINDVYNNKEGPDTVRVDSSHLYRIRPKFLDVTAALKILGAKIGFFSNRKTENSSAILERIHVPGISGNPTLKDISIHVWGMGDDTADYERVSEWEFFRHSGTTVKSLQVAFRRASMPFDSLNTVLVENSIGNAARGEEQNMLWIKDWKTPFTLVLGLLLQAYEDRPEAMTERLFEMQYVVGHSHLLGGKSLLTGERKDQLIAKGEEALKSISSPIVISPDQIDEDAIDEMLNPISGRLGDSTAALQEFFNVPGSHIELRDLFLRLANNENRMSYHDRHLAFGAALFFEGLIPRSEFGSDPLLTMHRTPSLPVQWSRRLLLHSLTTLQGPYLSAALRTFIQATNAIATPITGTNNERRQIGLALSDLRWLRLYLTTASQGNELIKAEAIRVLEGQANALLSWYLYSIDPHSRQWSYAVLNLGAMLAALPTTSITRQLILDSLRKRSSRTLPENLGVLRPLYQQGELQIRRMLMRPFRCSQALESQVP